MLYNWYNIRVKDLDVGKTECRYNVKYLPVYATDIIFAYAEALTKGAISELAFRSAFDKWLSSVKSGNNKYMVPYNVYKIKEDRYSHITPDGHRFLETVFEGLSCDIASIWDTSDIQSEQFYELSHIIKHDPSLHEEVRRYIS